MLRENTVFWHTYFLLFHRKGRGNWLSSGIGQLWSGGRKEKTTVIYFNEDCKNLIDLHLDQS